MRENNSVPHDWELVINDKNVSTVTPIDTWRINFSANFRASSHGMFIVV